MRLRLPTDQQRLAIYGATGSGKTQAAVYHLSLSDIESKPWIIIDFKHDDVIEQIPYTRTMNVNDPLPDKPGIYIVRPDPWESDETDFLLKRIWKRGDTGILIDEGHMLDPRGEGLRAVITQGRSKHIPMIHLSQRPKWISKHVMTEPEFHRVFRLQDPDDIKYVSRFTDPNIFRDKNTHDRIYLPDYHSYWHDVGLHETHTLPPVPELDSILSTFEQRLGKRKIYA